MVKAKKDMMDRKLYASIKKHPILKNPILLWYGLTFIFIIVMYVMFELHHLLK